MHEELESNNTRKTCFLMIATFALITYVSNYITDCVELMMLMD